MADPVPQPTPAAPDLTWLWVAVVVGLVMFRGGCTGTVTKPPIAAEKLTVALIHDGSDINNLPKWANDTDANSVDAFVKSHGGEYRIIEQKSDMKNSAVKWQDAVRVFKDSGKPPPLIVAATPTGGFAAPATTEDEATKALAAITGGK